MNRQAVLLRLLALTVVVAVAAFFRFGAIAHTVVDHPLRADAKDYYFYALHLQRDHVYSRAASPASEPEPDALRAPGFPLAVSPLMDWPPTPAMLYRVSFVLAFLDCLTVAMLFGLLLFATGNLWIAAGAGLLAALSPHLVSMTTFFLSETLFTFLLMAGLLLCWAAMHRQQPALAALGGAVLACSALTRPTMEYFLIVALGLAYFSDAARRFRPVVLPLLLAFLAVFLPWKIRNLLVIGALSDPSLMIGTLQHGMYPDFMFEGIPESLGYPYRFDPRSAEIGSSLSSVLAEIQRRFAAEPWRHLQWYLWGKPLSLLSWTLIEGVGQIFVYPVQASPYLDNSAFRSAWLAMFLLHWPLTAIGVIVTALAWLRPTTLALGTGGLLAVRLLSAVLLYFILLHIVAAPFPRYGIPLRPVVYGLAAVGIAAIGQRFRNSAKRRTGDAP